MAFKEFSTDYLVLEAENATLFDLFRIFYSTDLDKRDFFDAPTGSIEALLASFRHRWVVFVSVAAQKLLLLGRRPMRWIGSTTELLLNYPITNGGYSNLLVNILKGRVVSPDIKSSTFRSLIGNLDSRVELDKNIKKGDNRYNAALSIMASKLCYENQAFVESVVRDKWQMEFLNFYNFYNDYLDTYSTQAIIFQDKENNPDLVTVAFRGTEPFNPDDWRTDVDLSWYELPGLGRIHAGFMKALGLQKDKGWPKEIDQNNHEKPYAYYTLREQLRKIVLQNKKTKFIITGHSLGGALAILFVSILVLHEEEILLERFEGVYTFGQPRVGDEEFGEFMKKNLRDYNVGYHRYVYANDIVPRLPYDDKTLYYKHFGPSLYFNVFYKGQILEEEPNKNYFSLMWVLPKYLNAILELIRSSILPCILGAEYKEGCFEILYRMLIGLIIPGLSNHGPQDYDNVTRLASSISSLSMNEITGQLGLKVD